MLKKNFKVVSPRGELSGSEVNDLYKIYTSMDGKHKKFKGSKEEYITKVSELIKKFVDSSMNGPKVLKSPKGDETTNLQGGVKLRDILNRNKLVKELPELKKKKEELKTEKEQLEALRPNGAAERNAVRRAIRQLTTDIKKVAETNTGIVTRDATKLEKARAVVESEFPAKQEIFKKKMRYIEGTLPDQAESGVYFESDLQHVINPFYISPEGGDVPSFVGSTSQKYQQLVEYTAKYYSFVKTILTSALPENTKAGHAPTPVNKTMLRNFLIAAPFQHLTELSPRGRSQREEFASHLTSLGRKTLVGTTKMGWTETEEGSYRSEQFVYWGYLAQSETNPIKRTCKQFELLGKIFSLETANERVDYNFKLYTGESKGRKTLDGVFQQKGTKRPQIDLDKIISIIAHAATIDPDGKVHYNYPNALFTLYKSDMQLVKYDETKPLVGEERKMTEKVPFEVILRLNLLKVIEAAEGVTIPSLARGPEIKPTSKGKLGIVYPVIPLTAPKERPLLKELNEIIKDYHKLRKEGKPKFSGKLLSFEKNKERIGAVATALLQNFFIETEKGKVKLEKQALPPQAEQYILDNAKKYFKKGHYPEDLESLKTFMGKRELNRYLKAKKVGIAQVFNEGYSPEILKDLKATFIKDAIASFPKLATGDLYTGKLVDLDISQPYIAKHIEVVGYSKSLFTVNGRLQQPTALNYSKFFVKGEGADRAWLERYQDFTGDTPDNYTFKKIDIEAPIIESHGEFTPIEDVTKEMKQSLKTTVDELTDKDRLTVINKMVQYIKGNNESDYSKLPSSYEQNKLLNFFITKYPYEADMIVSDIRHPNEDDGVEESKTAVDETTTDDDDETTTDEDETTTDEDETTTDDDDETTTGEGGAKRLNSPSGGGSKPKGKPKAYHKKVIKYY